MRLLIFFIFYYLFLLWYGVNFLSFSIIEFEALDKFWLLKNIINLSITFFGKNDFSIRLPQILFSSLSVILFYNISKKIFNKKNDIYAAVIIFSLIPGFVISSIIINKSIYLVFLVLLLFYLYIEGKKLFFVLLFLLIFIDYSFISLYIALIFYAIYKKDNKFLIYSLILLALNANYFNYTIGGKPRGYFLDVIGTYVLIFSPFVFLYFLYSLYKGFFYKKDVLFFISVTSFLLSILFSFRQRIKIDDYAPFVLPYVIFMVKTYLNSYRVRLPKFRFGYRLLFTTLFSTLILFDLMLFFNKYTPARNLSESFYFIKPLIKVLKVNKINYLTCNNQYLCKALYFYGVKKGKDYSLYYSKGKKEVSIFHKNNKILSIDVSKLNTL
ncbi:membrane protein [Caminibacter profundus]